MLDRRNHRNGGQLEEDFRRRVIHDLECRGIHIINLRKGTFDAISDTPNPKMIEFKIMKDNRVRWERKLIASRYAITFTEEQSSELKKAQHNFPIVAVKDRGRFFLVSSSLLRRKARTPDRQKDHVMISRKHLHPARPMRYEQFIDKAFIMLKAH